MSAPDFVNCFKLRSVRFYHFGSQRPAVALSKRFMFDCGGREEHPIIVRVSAHFGNGEGHRHCEHRGPHNDSAHEAGLLVRGVQNQEPVHIF